MVLEKHISIRSATAGRSRKTLSGRKLGCGVARAERVMEDIGDIIAPVNSDKQKGFITILIRQKYLPRTFSAELTFQRIH